VFKKVTVVLGDLKIKIQIEKVQKHNINAAAIKKVKAKYKSEQKFLNTISDLFL